MTSTEGWTTQHIPMFPLLVFLLLLSCSRETPSDSLPSKGAPTASVAATATGPTLEQFCQRACERAVGCARENAAGAVPNQALSQAPGPSDSAADCRRQCTMGVPQNYGENKALVGANQCVNAPSCEEFEHCWMSVISQRREAMR